MAVTIAKTAKIPCKEHQVLQNLQCFRIPKQIKNAGVFEKGKKTSALTF